MKYLYLLYADESKMAAPGSPQFEKQNDAFNSYFAEIDGKGMFKAGDPVQPSKPPRQCASGTGPPRRPQGPSFTAATSWSAST